MQIVSIKRISASTRCPENTDLFNFFYFCFLSLIASANVCNVLLMRHSELSEGISVLDEHGNVVATSKLAARRVSGLWELLVYTDYKYNTYGCK